MALTQRSPPGAPLVEPVPDDFEVIDKDESENRMKQIEKLLTEFKPAPVTQKTATRTVVKATNSVSAIFHIHAQRRNQGNATRGQDRCVSRWQQTRRRT